MLGRALPSSRRSAICFPATRLCRAEIASHPSGFAARAFTTCAYGAFPPVASWPGLLQLLSLPMPRLEGVCCMLNQRRSIPAGSRGRSAVWPPVCLSAHVAVLLRSLFPKPIAPVLPATQGPWRERGAVAARRGARGIPWLFSGKLGRADVVSRARSGVGGRRRGF